MGEAFDGGGGRPGWAKGLSWAITQKEAITVERKQRKALGSEDIELDRRVDHN